MKGCVMKQNFVYGAIGGLMILSLPLQAQDSTTYLPLDSDSESALFGISTNDTNNDAHLLGILTPGSESLPEFADLFADDLTDEERPQELTLTTIQPGVNGAP